MGSPADRVRFTVLNRMVRIELVEKERPQQNT